MVGGRWQVLGSSEMGRSIPNSQFPIPNSQFPIPNSQFPIPNSQFPILNSYSLFPKKATMRSGKSSCYPRLS
ncbi:MAG: hypothetical protein F6K31_32280 [Symploca sp. SIO2G7]|nr:hypothetical protein [Symploca sp. SIO2G7]